jgi:hypothetical protein
MIGSTFIEVVSLSEARTSRMQDHAKSKYPSPEHLQRLYWELPLRS